MVQLSYCRGVQPQRFSKLSCQLFCFGDRAKSVFHVSVQYVGIVHYCLAVLLVYSYCASKMLTRASNEQIQKSNFPTDTQKLDQRGWTMSKRPDPPGDSPPPPSKRQKEATPAKKQSSLLNFFAKKKEPLGKKLGENDAPKKSNAGVSKLPPSSSSAKVAKLFLPIKDSSVAKKPSDNDDKSAAAAAADKDAPIIPHQVKPEKGARWRVLHNCLLVRTVPTEEPRTKVASFDLDGTLLVWRIAGWPSQYQHYELWNATGVASKFRTLHDEGYKLVIFSNQGAIRSAVTGKKATFMKSLIECCFIINSVVN